jgi:hypothetical protein
MNKRVKKVGPRRADVRRLKIQSQLRCNAYSEKFVPEIKLAGNWLEKRGFENGKRVVVTTMNGY